MALKVVGKELEVVDWFFFVESECRLWVKSCIESKVGNGSSQEGLCFSCFERSIVSY